MDLKRKNIPNNTISRDMVSLSADTGNVYETVMVIAKRAKQQARRVPNTDKWWQPNDGRERTNGSLS